MGGSLAKEPVSTDAPASNSKPLSLEGNADFFSRMELIENLSVIENLSDKDVEAVIKDDRKLPKSAEMRDKDDASSGAGD